MGDEAMVLDLHFGTRAAFEAFLKDLGEEAGIRQNVVRGRVTASGAWIRIEISGDAGEVDALLRRSGIVGAA